MSPLQLEGNVVDTRDQEIATLRLQLRQMDEALRLERNKTGQMEAGVREVRSLLAPLHRSLRLLFGEMDAMEIKESPPSQIPSAATAAWDAWKQRLGVPCGKIISALQVHRSMTQTQIAIATGIRSSNIPTYIFRINRAGLINKNGRELSLKEL